MLRTGEARRLGQLRPVGRGVLRRPLDLRALLGIDVDVVVGDEPDVEGLPHAHDERLAAGAQQFAGLADRQIGELGAVVGDHDRARTRRRAHRACRASSATAPGAARPLTRSRANSGGEDQRRPRRRGTARCRAPPAARRRARRATTAITPPATASPAPIHSAMPAPPNGRADGGGEVGEDRRDHERRDRAQQLDDREHPLQVGRRQREAGDEQRRRDGRADADPGQPGADQRERLAGRQLDRGRR